MNQLDMAGRHAVITGGATGLGFAIAQRVLASGGTVRLRDRGGAAAARACGQMGAGARALAVDFADHAAVAQAVRDTLAHTPAVDALVNSAGITGPNAMLWDYPVDDWAKVMQVNLNGLFYCCRAWVPRMLARDYGRIVNFASVAGKDGNPNASAYSASKAASSRSSPPSCKRRQQSGSSRTWGCRPEHRSRYRRAEIMSGRPDRGSALRAAGEGPRLARVEPGRSLSITRVFPMSRQS